MNNVQSRAEFSLPFRDVEALWNSTHNLRDRLLIKCLYFLGLRRFEAVNLRVGDLFLDKLLVVVEKGKGGKTRYVPIVDANLASELRLLVEGRKEGAVFESQREDKLTNSRINQIVARAGLRAGIRHPNVNQKYINPHLLRHSIARHLKSLGYPAEFIQKFLGHSSIKTTMDSYGTMGVDEMQMIIAKKTGNLPPKHLQNQNIRGELE